MFRILLVLVLLVFSAPAFAQSETERAAREVNAAIVELSDQTAKYEALSTEALALVDIVMDRLDEAFELAERKGGKAAADRWAAEWIPQTRQRFAEIKSRLQALPAIDISRFERAAGTNSRESMQFARMVATVKPGTAQSIDAVQELFETIARYAPLAAAGDDEEAALRLGLAALQASQTMLQVENLTLQRTLAAVGEDHPQYWLGKSSMSSNNALIEIIEAGLSEATDPDFKPRSHAEKIASHVKDARESARQAPRRAQTMSRASLQDPELRNTELGQKLTAMLATYDGSAKVEEKICDKLLELQRSLERKGAVLGEIEQGMTDLEPLFDQRMKLDAARREVVSR